MEYKIIEGPRAALHKKVEVLSAMGWKLHEGFVYLGTEHHGTRGEIRHYAQAMTKPDPDPEAPA